jgi:hypothetical protein
MKNSITAACNYRPHNQHGITIALGIHKRRKNKQTNAAK